MADRDPSASRQEVLEKFSQAMQLPEEEAGNQFTDLAAKDDPAQADMYKNLMGEAKEKPLTVTNKAAEDDPPILEKRALPSMLEKRIAPRVTAKDSESASHTNQIGKDEEVSTTNMSNDSADPSESSNPVAEVESAHTNEPKKSEESTPVETVADETEHSSGPVKDGVDSSSIPVEHSKEG